MVYFDYASSTPVDDEVLKTYSMVSIEYYNKIFSNNDLGKRSELLLNTSLNEMAKNLGASKEEIILTNGLEDNYRVLMDIISSNKNKRKKIIVSKLESPSMYKFIKKLEDNNYSISYVNNDENGLIDLNHLKKLINNDTLLVSIPYVNGDLGVRQPIKIIKQIIKKENENVIFFSDLSYAFGRISINFKDIDIGMMISDNAYGIKGKGIVFKKNNLKIYNKYEIDLPSIVALSKMVKLNIDSLNEREKKVIEIHDLLSSELGKYKGLYINSNKFCVPYIINISLMDRNTKDIVNCLNDYEIYLSNMDDQSDLSTSVMAVYGNKIRSLTSIRISLSHLVSYKEIDYFLTIFNNVYFEGGVNYEKDNVND